MLSNHVQAIDAEQWRTAPGEAFQTWRIPQCPFLLECAPAVLEQIRREVQRGRESQRGEQETGGVLFGILDPQRIRILAAKPLPCEHAMGAGFILSQRDEQRLAQLIAAPATESELHGLQALGWYHSHIRSPIFLSARDLQIHSRYFSAPYQIALVLHPRSEGPARAGFFFRELSGEMRTESSYEEFTVESPLPPAVSQAAPSQERTPSPTKPAEQRAAICPKCGSQRLRRSRRRGPIERWYGVLGLHPYRCQECLSRSFLKTSPDILERLRSGSRKRPEERRRARERTRREILLWGGGILGFLAILHFLIRDTGPKSDSP